MSLKRLITGFGALILSAALLVGLPALLVFLAGNPIPSWDRLVQALSMPDYGGEFLIGTVIPILAWIAWAWFAVGYLAEIPNQVRAFSGGRGQHGGSRRVTVPGLGLSQKGAGVLIAAVLTLFAPAGAFAATTDGAPVDASPVTISASASSTQTSTTDEAPPAVEDTAALYTVAQGDSLWAIAETHLGDGDRWQEVFELNKDRPQPDGLTIGQRQGIDPGMQLELPVAPAAAPAAAVTVDDADRVVQPGDTLWGIAEQELGSGDRYMEIFDASTAIAQPGGAQLTDPSVILPGWSLDVTPGTAAPAPAPAVAPAPVEAPAEEAAAEEAAAAEEVPAAEASVEEAAPDADTGLGYVTSDEEAPAEADAPAAPTSADEKVTADASDDLTWLDIVTDWRTVGGMGGILAAGLLTLLGWRRRQQRRNRKIGQRIQMPSEQVSLVEQSMRTVEAPHDMDAVDLALRTLSVWAQDTGAQLPALYALQLSEDTISLFLDNPAQLPEPFEPLTDDAMAWSVTYERLAPLERIPSSPYPALVTIGRDENGAQLLVDLERLGSLNIQGARKHEHAVLSAIALELASTPWGENLQVTLVGFGEQLPDAIGHTRLRYVEDTPTLVRNLRGQAAAVGQALAAEGVASIEEARTARPDADSWTPEIVILGELSDEGTRAELADLVTQLPRVGVAAIAAGHLAGGWNLLLEETVGEAGETIVTGELEIPDSEGAALPLTPQMVTQEYLEAVLSMFTVANNDQAIDHSVASPEISVDEIPEVLDDETGSVDEVAVAEVSIDEVLATFNDITAPMRTQVFVDPSAATAGDDEAAPAAAAETVDAPDVDEEISAAAETPIDDAAPTVDAGNEEVPVDEAASEVDDATAEYLEDDAVDGAVAQVRDLRVPRVQVLGPVVVLNPQGVTPTTETGIKQWNSQVLRATELIAYLVTHHGAKTKAVHEAMWGIGSDVDKGTASRNKLTNSARRWLGSDSAGTPFFPPALGGVYELADTVRSDWDDWCDLVGDEPTQAPTANLARALELVKGQPFSDVKDKYYAWAADELKPSMISAIADAAHELATRSLRSGKIRDARKAAAVGRMVEPENETHWRNSLRAEHLAGDTAGIDRLIPQLELAGKRIDPLYSEVEPETQELIDQIRGDDRGRDSMAS